MVEAVKGRYYRHTKGGVYQVLMIAEHSETKEEMVIYLRLSDGKAYARPRSMFEDGRFQPASKATV